VASGSADYYDSKYSAPISVERRAAPKATANNFVVSTADNLSAGFTVNYNDENSLSAVVSYAYMFARIEYIVVRELPAGKGFADLTFIPVETNKPAMIIELKFNKTAQTAIDQIKAKEYPESLSAYSGDVLLVGINYDKATKKHECKIERITK